MPRGLRRYHESGQSHFVTFSCYRRQANFVDASVMTCSRVAQQRHELLLEAPFVMVLRLGRDVVPPLPGLGWNLLTLPSTPPSAPCWAIIDPPSGLGLC